MAIEKMSRDKKRLVAQVDNSEEENKLKAIEVIKAMNAKEIKEAMIFEEVKMGEDEDMVEFFQTIRKEFVPLYRSAFVADERRSLKDEVENVLKNKKFKIYYIKVGEVKVGFGCYWQIKTGDREWLFGEHTATIPELRNHHIGKVMLEKLVNEVSGRRTVIVEAERPKKLEPELEAKFNRLNELERKKDLDGVEKTEIKVLRAEIIEKIPNENRRAAYYKRAGAVMHNYDYIQPSYGEGRKPVPLNLFTFDSKENKNKGIIDDAEFEAVRNEIYKTVYNYNGDPEKLKQEAYQ